MAVTRSRIRKSPPVESSRDNTDSVTTNNSSNTNSSSGNNTTTMSKPRKRLKLNSTKASNSTKSTEVSNLTLQQLFDKSYLNEPIDWPSISSRIKSHPEEIEAKHLQNALMIYNPTTVPPIIIREMIQRSKKNIYSYSALQFAFTCPWVDMETVKALMDGPRSCLGRCRMHRSIRVRAGRDDDNDEDGDDDRSNRSSGSDEDIEGEIENEHALNVPNRHIMVFNLNNDEDNNDNDDDREVHGLRDAIDLIATAAVKTSKLHTHCSNILHSLYESCESPPPRFDAVKVMLKHIPQVLEIQDHSDRDLPLHSACWSNINAPFIELFVQTAIEMEDPAHRFGGLLVNNDYQISPMRLIIQKWNDDSGAEMIGKLIRMAGITKNAITESKLLFEAIKQHKWNIIKTIVRFAPQCLTNFGNQHNLPLHTVCTLPTTFGRDPAELPPDFLNSDVGIVEFMVEQSMLNNKDGPAVGGLLTQDWSGKTPLQLLNNVLRNRVLNVAAKRILKNILTFISKKIHGAVKTKSLGLLLHEAIRIKSQELITLIVETQPKSLQCKDDEGNLPLHVLSKTDASFNTMKLFIDKSLKQKVGPLKNRAGLYVTNNNGECAIEVILGRKCSSNGRVFKLLQDFKPKLITKKDVKDLNLLHKVANGGRPAIARAILKLLPGSIALKDKDGNLPLHIACKCNVNATSRELINIFMEYGLRHKVGGAEGFGGLYVKNNTNNTPMDVAIKNMYGERKWVALSIMMSYVPDAPILHSFISQRQLLHNIKTIIEKYPQSIQVEDSNGQLPIHLALSKNTGMSCETSLTYIVNAYPAGLDVSDPVTGLLPFALAATGSYSMNFQYNLLRKSPTFFSTKKWISKSKQTLISGFLV